MERDIVRCTRCYEVLKSKNIIWLELSNTDGNFYELIPDGHASQGLFPFGKHCSKIILQETKTANE